MPVCDFISGLTCMCNASSGCSPIRPSVIMTRFPASLDVWEDREEDEWRIEPWRFRGLQHRDNVETDRKRHLSLCVHKCVFTYRTYAAKFLVHVFKILGKERTFLLILRCYSGDWPVSVYEAHTLRAHVTVGGEDASGRVDPLAACRAESIHAGDTLLGPNHILLWIFTLLTNAYKKKST